jgi:hypothetical protein
MSKKPTRRRPRTRLILIGLGAFVLVSLIIAAFTARPAWRWVKAQRAEKLCEQALILLEQGEDQQVAAGEKLRKAWDLAPENPVVKRVWAQIMAEGGQELSTARMLYEQLNESGHATAEDQIARATIYARMGDFAQSNQIYDALPPDIQRSREGLELQARLRLAEGDVTSANEAYMESLRTSAADDPLSMVNLAVMQAADPFSEVSQTAREDLFMIAVNPDKAGITALERLAAMRNLQRDETRRVIELLDVHPMAGKRHHFLRRSLELRLDPGRKPAILEDELTAHADLPLSSSQEFLGWLLREGESDLLLRLLDIDSARHSQTLTGFYMQALVDQKRWRRLDTVLNDPNALPVTDTMRSLLQALVLHEMGGGQSEIAERVRHVFQRGWDDRDYRTVFGAASFSEQNGYHQLANEGYELLASRPELREAALSGLYRVAADRNDVNEMIEITERILVNTPHNEGYREIRCYLKLLTGYQMELAMADAQQLISTNERSNLRQFLVAFAHYRFGNTSLTRDILTRIDLVRLTPGHRAIAAWLLSSIGEEAEAYHLVQRVDDSLLLDEEAELAARVR